MREKKLQRELETKKTSSHSELRGNTRSREEENFEEAHREKIRRKRGLQEIETRKVFFKYKQPCIYSSSILQPWRLYCGHQHFSFKLPECSQRCHHACMQTCVQNQPQAPRRPLTSLSISQRHLTNYNHLPSTTVCSQLCPCFASTQYRNSWI